jgi:hypothetical protein
MYRGCKYPDNASLVASVTMTWLHTRCNWQYRPSMKVVSRHRDSSDLRAETGAAGKDARLGAVQAEKGDL